MIQFRHIRIGRWECGLLGDLLAAQDAAADHVVLVLEEITDDGLVFDPPLRHRGYPAEVLSTLQTHKLIDLTRRSDRAWRVYVTPVGRDYYDDMCGLT